MGEGMVRAALATIRARSWVVMGQPLTGDQVVEVFERIKRGQRRRTWEDGRRFDRAVEVLKEAGLIRFDRKVGWLPVGGDDGPGWIEGVLAAPTILLVPDPGEDSGYGLVRVDRASTSPLAGRWADSWRRVLYVDGPPASERTRWYHLDGGARRPDALGLVLRYDGGIVATGCWLAAATLAGELHEHFRPTYTKAQFAQLLEVVTGLGRVIGVDAQGVVVGGT